MLLSPSSVELVQITSRAAGWLWVINNSSISFLAVSPLCSIAASELDLQSVCNDWLSPIKCFIEIDYLRVFKKTVGKRSFQYQQSM